MKLKKFLQGVCVRNMSCKEAARLSSEAQERKLSFRERVAMHFHTTMCGGCNFYNKQITKLRELFEARHNVDEMMIHPHETLSKDFKTRCHQIIRDNS